MLLYTQQATEVADVECFQRCYVMHKSGKTVMMTFFLEGYFRSAYQAILRILSMNYLRE